MDSDSFEVLNFYRYPQIWGPPFAMSVGTRRSHYLRTILILVFVCIAQSTSQGSESTGHTTNQRISVETELVFLVLPDIF